LKTHICSRQIDLVRCVSITLPNQKQAKSYIADVQEVPYIEFMTRSYWQLLNPGRIKRLGFEPPGSCDIAIVGAGLMGLALAYFLRKKGCDRVIVLEKEYIGFGASGRNAGFLISGMAEPYCRLVVGMGHDPARLMMQATLENHDLIESAIRSLDIKCDYSRAGSFHLATTEVERRELAESVELLRADGFGGTFVSPDNIGDRIRFGKYAGGYFNPSDGCLDPFAFVKGLAAGSSIYEGFEVEEIRRGAGGVELAGKEKTIFSEMAVLTTNAYSPLIDPFFKDIIFPVRGQMLAAAPAATDPLGDSTYYANFGYDYFRKSSQGAILMGGLRNRYVDKEIGYDDETNPVLQSGLEEYVRRNFGIDQYKIICRWSGIMGNTIDGLPLIGSLPHNGAVLATVGCNGHGFGLDMVIARDLAAALIDGKTSDLLSCFSLKRFAR